MLFDGDPICDICCVYDLDAARGPYDIVELVCEWTGLTEHQIYDKCMSCKHSNKKGFYEIASHQNFVSCYFGDAMSVKKRMKKADYKRACNKRGKLKVYCNLFQKECVYEGNSVACTHGAWNDNSLISLLNTVRKELELRGHEICEDFDDGDDD